MSEPFVNLNDREKKLNVEVLEMHEQACEDKLDFYIDPDSKLRVSTRFQHLKRGFCCKSLCRHCPWNYKI